MVTRNPAPIDHTDPAASLRALTQKRGAPPLSNALQWVGGAAAILTSLSYLPQVRKALPRMSTEDLSLKMLIVLTSGLALWTVYGLIKGDWIIVMANSVGGTLTAVVLGCKLRDLYSDKDE